MNGRGYAVQTDAVFRFSIQQVVQDIPRYDLLSEPFRSGWMHEKITEIILCTKRQIIVVISI